MRCKLKVIDYKEKHFNWVLNRVTLNATLFVVLVAICHNSSYSFIYVNIYFVLLTILNMWFDGYEVKYMYGLID